TLGTEWRQYEQTFPVLAASRIDQVSIECANSRVPVSLLGLLAGKDVLVGAVDVATDAIETPAQVAATIRSVLPFVPPERLYPCTNCGMVPLDRGVARGKRAVALGRAHRPRIALRRDPVRALRPRRRAVRDARVRRAALEVQGAGQDRRHDQAQGESDREEGSLEARPRTDHAPAHRAEPARRGRPARRDGPDRGEAPVTGTYFEDVVVDNIQVTPAITVTETHVALYLGMTREAPLGSGAVPDVLPLCMVIGLG